MRASNVAAFALLACVATTMGCGSAPDADAFSTDDSTDSGVAAHDGDHADSSWGGGDTHAGDDVAHVDSASVDTASPPPPEDTAPPPPVDTGPPCPGGLSRCGGECVDLENDGFNCGACGKTCEGEEFCSGGTCGCSPGLADCSGSCVNTYSDPNNCGACGVACAGTSYCEASTCTCGIFGGTYCPGVGCVHLDSDRDHCGTCDNKCPAFHSCVGGTCL